MSQDGNAETSSSKRAYRKGKPLSATERQQAAVARKRSTHKSDKHNQLPDCALLRTERATFTALRSSLSLVTGALKANTVPGAGVLSLLCRNGGMMGIAGGQGTRHRAGILCGRAENVMVRAMA